MNEEYTTAEYAVRGDIYYVTRENDKNRPAVIVSNDFQNRYSGSVLVVYLTSQEKKPLPTHVSIQCKVPSTALCENVCSVPKEMLGSYIMSCTDKEMKEIDEGLCDALAIKLPDADAALLKENERLKLETEVYKKMYGELLERVLQGK